MKNRRFQVPILFLALPLFLHVQAAIGQSDKEQVTFQKTLRDGRKVIVTKSSFKEYREPDKAVVEALQKKSPTSHVGKGEVQINRYSLIVSEGEQKKATVWKKEQFNSGSYDKDGHVIEDPTMTLEVYDVISKGNRFAIVFSPWRSSQSGGVFLDVTEKKGDGEYEVVKAQTLWGGEFFGIATSGQLIWLDGLYAFLITSRGEELWAIGEKAATKVWPTK